MSTCKTCELTAKRTAGEAPIWDNIYRAAYWDVAHSYNTTLPGWLVLVPQRHIEAVDALTDEESIELGLLLKRVSQALKEATGCVKTYVMQFAEHPQHPHVHFHVVPRMADQPAERKGPRIFGYTGVSESERLSETEMNRLGLQIRQILNELA